MIWKDIEGGEKPKHAGPYLVEKMDYEGGDLGYAIEWWEPQEGIKTVYSKEFKQNIDIKTENGDLGFQENNYDFITRWIEIPGHIYTRGKQ